MKRISKLAICRLVGAVAILTAGHVSAQTTQKQDFEAAKQEYEQSPKDESARVTYVTKLAQIAGRLVSDYRRGERNDELMGAIDSELQKHPAPKDIDSKRLKQLLVGKWESPRRIYVYRANAKCGTEGGAIDGNGELRRATVWLWSDLNTAAALPKDKSDTAQGLVNQSIRSAARELELRR